MAEAKKRVFIAEDEEAALSTLERLLVIAGFEVSGTSKPKEIIDKVKAFKPQIILLDLLMPEIGGLEVCELLDKDNATRDIPIIIVSSLGGYHDIIKAYNLGVVGYIQKPYDFSKLSQEIARVLTHYKGR